jgi:hypothetical protein
MFLGIRRPRILTARQLTSQVFQPLGEQLEVKILMAINLGGTGDTAQPIIATAPFGVDMVNGSATTPGTANAGAGYSVADVADLTGKSTFDSLVIGAPGITSPTTLSGANGTVYVEFGSNFAQSSSNLTATQNWLNTIAGPNLNSTGDRVGNLNTLGSPTQTNPMSGVALTFPFTGVTFTGPASFGASVAGLAFTPGGKEGIIVGAPMAGANGSGEAFVIFGNFAADAGMTINVASPPSNLTVITIVNNSAQGTNGALGTSVAGGSNILGDGAGDVILGAPNASVAPTNVTFPVAQDTGVVYVISAAAVPSSTSTIDVSTLLTASTIDFAGAASGDQAGFSVADGGDVNGAAGNVDDLLIGAPAANAGAGAAYLVYGGGNLAGLRTTVNGIPFISLTNLSGGSGTGNVPGATFVGSPSSGTNSALGMAVSAGGDFNGDGFGDILLSEPTWSASPTFANQGEVYLFYGAASTSGAALTGLINLGSVSPNLPFAEFDGGAAGDLAGWSISQTGVINKGQPTGILIGSPGFNGMQGAVYLIPGRANFSGEFALETISTTPTAPLVGLQFTVTTPSFGTADTFFGGSVSSRIQGTQINTVDLDNEADFIFGAPGYQAYTGAPLLNGGAQIVQSGFLVVPVPQALTVTVQIGVGAAFGPFSINATTPTTLQIFVFGSTATTPSFMPVTDIDPTTVKVDGVAFPNATLTADTNTANFLNGIPDAIITISPRSALALVNGSQTFTITGQTLASSPLPGFTWTGTATVTVTGGTGGGGASAAAAAAPATGPVIQTQFVSPFGANQYTPSITALSALSYAPIPLSVALAEYLPGPGFRTRLYEFNHPNKKVQAQRGQKLLKGRGTVSTLGPSVFDRGAFHPQRVYVINHKAKKVGDVTGGVLPIQSRTETFDDDLLR